MIMRKSKMTLDEMLAKAGANRQRKRPSDEEHRLQEACVRWFRLKYPHLSARLFAVPNGGRRDGITGARLKEEGVLAGVSDLVLLVPNGRYHALLIEMKTPKGRQSESQRAWQRAVTENGDYRYVVCRSLEEFMGEVNDYLNDFE